MGKWPLWRRSWLRPERAIESPHCRAESLMPISHSLVLACRHDPVRISGTAADRLGDDEAC